MMNLDFLESLSESNLSNELARRNLIDFTTQTNPDFITGWFNKIIARELQQFYQDIVDGKQPRLMIFAPPRSGKSELFSRRFPAWAFGKNPDLQMIACSYSADLASRMNRDVQRIMDDESYLDIFPQSSLNNKRIAKISGQALRNSEIFEIIGHKGAYRSAGVGGGITGMGADIAIIDDPVKDAKEANSQTVRDSVWDWYTTTLYTRLSPKSGVLLGMTRWHEDDLAGRLLQEMENGGDQWRVISFPAIAEQDEEYRKEGEPLHPERFDLERLMKIKNAVGSHTWTALYQQRPTLKGGGLIKGDWFARYKIPPIIRIKAIYADTAQKTKEHNDYSVFLVAGKGNDGKVYILDLIRGKWEAPDLERTLKDVWAKHSAIRETGVLTKANIEDKSSGTSLIQNIRRNSRIPISPVQVDSDKYTRVLGVQGYIESGYVCLPENAPWVADFIAECEAFTATDSHKHDDQVDALVMAISDLLGKSKSLLDC
ncbi:Transposase and inactivated derivatives [Canicola haemoglobinophilus]|uniref:Transposase and inactivated derivatives n=1 Tax=Canicola haemoglobinophilus TaxID=733 RepID=A0AB38H998_9PAST|nr:phage terminase large subunit [Canicola haemoglobinophilus]STO54410.1 Transposase and inactivated derivatives [Canicola haemoglobinophilus]STO68944.1 Transposase and inactivated derivatives [Canicola haemoglobinophilus]